jgi:hypothetical protein
VILEKKKSSPVMVIGGERERVERPVLSGLLNGD